MPFVSDQWGVEVRWFHHNLHRIWQIPMNCRYELLLFFRRREKFSQNLFRLLRSLCFARIGLNPLSGEILNNDSVPEMVSWFTLLVEDFVISRCQVTKFFCPTQSFASASSARSPCRLGSQADFAIFVFWEVSKHSMLPLFIFVLGFWGWSTPPSWRQSVTSLWSWTCWRQILRCRCWWQIALRTGG